MSAAPSSADAFASANAESDESDGAAAGGAAQPGCAAPPGVKICGRPEFERQALSALAQLAAVPSGAALLKRIADSGRTCVIMESLDGNTCGYTNGADATVQADGRPGPGSNSMVRFNPVLESIGPRPWQTRPPAIALGHEMIHGMHAAEGTIDRRLEVNDGRVDDAGVPKTTKYEELRTVGVPPHDVDPVNENALRREWPTPQAQRPWY
jgi:type VI secretion system secreted protein VgrG